MMQYLPSTARMRKIPTQLPYSWCPTADIGNCGWLPVHNPSGPLAGGFELHRQIRAEGLMDIRAIVAAANIGSTKL
jgi:hypothetical protein